MSSFKGVLEILVRKFSYFDFIDCLLVLSTPKSGILKQKEHFTVYRRNVFWERRWVSYFNLYCFILQYKHCLLLCNFSYFLLSAVFFCFLLSFCYFFKSIFGKIISVIS